MQTFFQRESITVILFVIEVLIIIVTSHLSHENTHASFLISCMHTLYQLHKYYAVCLTISGYIQPNASQWAVPYQTN